METMKLSQISKIIMGQSPPSSTYNTLKQGLPFFQGKADFGAIHPKIRMYCSEPTKLAEQNDILMSVRAPVGDVNIADRKCAIGRGLAAIRAIDDITDQRFLYFALIHQKNKIADLGTGSIFQAINKSQLFDFPINVFAFEEQKTIGLILSTLQKAIQKQKEIVSTTTDLKKSLLNKLFTEGTKGEPLKKTEIGMMPESWEVVPLGKHIKFFGGFAFKSSDVVKQGTSTTQLVRMGNLYQNRLDLNRSPTYYPDEYVERYSRYLLNAGDLIISLTGTMGKEDYGFTVEVPRVEKNLLLNQRVAKLVIDEEELDKDFVRCFMLSRMFLDRLYPTAQGTKQANLSTNVIQKLPFIVPEKAEQILIAKAVISIEQKLIISELKKGIYEQLFNTLLNELMTGAIRVNSINFSSKDSSQISLEENSPTTITA